MTRISEGSLARFVFDLVGEFDQDGLLKSLYEEQHRGTWGQAAHSPRMLVQLLFYSYCCGIVSSRNIQQSIEENLTFRYLAENERPDFRVLMNFRRDHLGELHLAFVELLRLCRDLGLEKLGRVALAGTNVQSANLSIDAQVTRILAEAERRDRNEDVLYGREQRGNELPDELRTKEGRLRRLQEVRLRQREGSLHIQSIEDRQNAAVEEAKSRSVLAGSLRGTIADLPFPQLLGRLFSEKATGAVEFLRGYRKKILYLKDGLPIHVESNLVSECLGTLLVRSNVINQSQCDTSLRKMMASGKPQGAVLVEMGCISEKNLARVLELQLQRKLYNLFSWEEGNFEFRPGETPPPLSVTLQVPTIDAIFKGIKSQTKFERLVWQLDGHLNEYVVQRPGAGREGQILEKDPECMRLWMQLDGERTLKQLRDQFREQERFYQLVYSLLCCGMIEFTTQAAPPSQERVRTQAPSSAPDEDLPERERLAAKILEMKGKNFFDLLGLPTEASHAQVEKTFESLIKQYSPEESTGRQSTQVRLLRTEIFNNLCHAYNALVDDKRREEYLRQLVGGSKEAAAAQPALDPGETMDPDERALALVHRGEAALHKGDAAWAKVVFEQAVKLCPNEAKYHALLGLTLYRLNPNSTAVVRQARDQLNRALSLKPELDIAHLYLGQVYLKMGHELMAKHEFLKALQSNPGCTDALRELKMLKKRNQERKVGGKLTRRIFGK